MLETYLKCKDTELGKAATECRSQHCCKIIRIYTAEMENSTKAVYLSGDIIQDTYYLLSANHLLTNAMDEKMNQLAKIHDGQRGVRFNGVDDVQYKPNDFDDEDLSHAQHIDEITLEDGLDAITANEDAIFAIATAPSASTRVKRALQVDEKPMPMPKRFGVGDMSPLDITQVLATHSNDEESICVKRPIVGRPPLKASNGPFKKPAMRALKDANPNLNKDCAVARNAMKAMVNGRPVALKEKENKRFLTVVGKSPRRSPGASAKSKHLENISAV